KKPVDSSTTSTPRSFHGSLAGSRSARTLISMPSTSSPSSRTSIVPGNGPRIESYFRRWPSVALSVMSLTATHSMSVSFARPARSTFRPMRPNPLIPTRTDMCQSLLRCRSRSGRRLPRAARPPFPGSGAAALLRTAHELEPGAVGIDQISGVVVRRSELARRGRAPVAAAGGDAGPVGGVDRAAPGGGDGDVAVAGAGAGVSVRAAGAAPAGLAGPAGPAARGRAVG